MKIPIIKRTELHKLFAEHKAKPIEEVIKAVSHLGFTSEVVTREHADWKAKRIIFARKVI